MNKFLEKKAEKLVLLPGVVGIGITKHLGKPTLVVYGDTKIREEIEKQGYVFMTMPEIKLDAL